MCQSRYRANQGFLHFVPQVFGCADVVEMREGADGKTVPMVGDVLVATVFVF